MTEKIVLWVESKNDETVEDEDILEYLRFFFTTILDSAEKRTYFHHSTRGQTLCYEIEIKDLDEFRYMVRTFGFLLDFFYETLLKHDQTYHPFIENVPKTLKQRERIDHKNWAVIRIKIKLLDDLRKLFDNYNRVYPKLFVHMYFEEVADGYIGFFQKEFDINAVFQDPANSRSGELWLKHHGFNVPNWYLKERTKWLFSRLQKSD